MQGLPVLASISTVNPDTVSTESTFKQLEQACIYSKQTDYTPNRSAPSKQILVIFSYGSSLYSQAKFNLKVVYSVYYKNYSI